MFKLVSRSRSLMEGNGDAGRPAAAKASVTHVPDEPLHGGPGAVSDNTLRTSAYNDHAALPVNASKVAQQYASRPLPAPPPPRSKMAERPSTSGGPNSRETLRNDFNFDKRISRDDFYLGTKTYGGTRSRPSPALRDQPPTPDDSPRSVPVQRFASAPIAWVPTINAMRPAPNEDIGMALGSPTHPPTTSVTWNSQGVLRHRKDSTPSPTPPASRSNSVDTFDMPVLKKPPSKWKLLGMFGRKHSDQSVPAVLISEPNGLKDFHRPEEAPVVASQPQPALKSPIRSNTTSSRKAPKHKPIVVRSQTMPLGVTGYSYDQNARGNDKNRDEKFGRIPIALDTGPGSSPVTGPLLNVEIPDVRLERYSVMFNSVLNSNSSLMARRQVTVPKLKSIEDAAEREEEEKVQGVIRRATSPQPAIQPSGFALFPTSRQGHFTPQKLSPRLRSNTLPALFSSSSKATPSRPVQGFKRPSVDETPASNHPRRPSHPHEQCKAASAMASKAIVQVEVSRVPHFSNDQSNLVLDSPTEIEPVTYDAVKTQPLKPAAHHLPPEPKWQMISPSQKTPSTASSSTSSYRKRSPSLASSSRTQTTQYSQDFDEPSSYPENTPNSGLKLTPVEISIARQISMSREQRKLLQPLRTGLSPSPSASPGGSKPSRGSPARTSPMAGVAMGQNERLVETKTSTPTLVHPPETLDPQLLLAQHRKSEWIVLEGA
ncbi:hypothetical protein F5Y19DRAFT_6645 [Xylariaceae sp. FL1651]|nr:hypothetical protein F5Y19DRAFT_6645 [Xylariaceae sp. FL1651]